MTDPVIPLQKVKGFVRLQGHRKIAINFPEEIFLKVKQRAEDAEVSFTVMAVKLIDCGIFDYEDSERHEPKKARR